MSPAKRFLLILFSVAIVGWLLGNAFFGPPGFTDEYMAQFKADHERYLKITKSEAYHLYTERPHLHGPDTAAAPPQFAEDLAFVKAYTARPAYQAEVVRQARYGFFFDLFNGALVVALAWYFGRKPLLRYLDTQIDAIRRKVDDAARVRAEAEMLTKEVEAQMARLPEDEQRIAQETEHRLEKEMADLAEASHYSMGLMEREMADRKDQQWLRARQEVQRELVLSAINALKEQCANSQSAAFQDGLIDEFIDTLERGRA